MAPKALLTLFVLATAAIQAAAAPRNITTKLFPMVDTPYCNTAALAEDEYMVVPKPRQRNALSTLCTTSSIQFTERTAFLFGVISMASCGGSGVIDHPKLLRDGQAHCVEAIAIGGATRVLYCGVLKELKGPGDKKVIDWIFRQIWLNEPSKHESENTIIHIGIENDLTLMAAEHALLIPDWIPRYVKKELTLQTSTISLDEHLKRLGK